MGAARRDLLRHVALRYFRAESFAGNFQMKTIRDENLSSLIFTLPDNGWHDNLTSTNGEPHRGQCTQDAGYEQNCDHQDNAGPARKLAFPFGFFFSYDFGFLHVLNYPSRVEIFHQPESVRRWRNRRPAPVFDFPAGSREPPPRVNPHKSQLASAWKRRSFQGLPVPPSREALERHLPLWFAKFCKYLRETSRLFPATD